MHNYRLTKTNMYEIAKLYMCIKILMYDNYSIKILNSFQFCHYICKMTNKTYYSKECIISKIIEILYAFQLY